MSWKVKIVGAAAVVGLTGLAAVAQQSPTPPPPTKAERISDRAIASLVAWKIKAGENVLTANEKELGSTPEYRMALGLLRATQGKGDEAVALLQQAVADSPGDPAPAYYLGEVLFWRQKEADATKAWREARDRAKALVAAAGDNARAQYYLGAAQARLKQLGPARTALEAAREAGWDPVLVDYQLGLASVLADKWRDAVTAFDKVADRDPKFAFLYFYRGLAWGKLDRTDKMLVDLDQFVKLAPDAPEAAIAQTYLAAAQR